VELETILESPIVADPLRLYDFCPITDGSAALMLCPESVADEYADDYVVISGSTGRRTPTSSTSARIRP